MTEPFVVTAAQEGITLAAFLRGCLPGQSWSQVRALVEQRRVELNGELWLDPARRVHAGERVAVLARPKPKPPEAETIVLRHLDEHVVVVEKPAGMNTVRHPAERDWTEHRKALSPTLQDLVPRRIAHAERRPSPGRLRVVHRLDKETSGLLVFARTVHAERVLGRQFHDHTVLRRYLAVAHGAVRPGTIRTRLVRDRGDGRRGSGSGDEGKDAVTHVELLEALPGGYSLIACRLETGRTHQIRIHLAERGHPICGEPVYTRRPDGTTFDDRSGAPRLCLHAAELGFVHPGSGEAMRWEMPLPDDLDTFLRCLRAG